MRVTEKIKYHNDELLITEKRSGRKKRFGSFPTISLPDIPDVSLPQISLDNTLLGDNIKSSTGNYGKINIDNQ